jgi:hypothetical protein
MGSWILYDDGLRYKPFLILSLFFDYGKYGELTTLGN